MTTQQPLTHIGSELSEEELEDEDDLESDDDELKTKKKKIQVQILKQAREKFNLADYVKLYEAC